MNNNIVADIVAQEEGLKIKPTWGTTWSNAGGGCSSCSGTSNANGASWSNLTDAEKAALENAKGGSGSGSTGSGINWGQTANNALNLFNQWQDNKNQGNTNTTYTPEPEKSKTGLYIGLGLGAVILGVAVWYFGFKKK